jgi:hypothetical protein
MKKMCIHLFFKGAVIVTKVIIVFFLFNGKTYDEKNNEVPTDVGFLNKAIIKIV